MSKIVIALNMKFRLVLVKWSMVHFLLLTAVQQQEQLIITILHAYKNTHPQARLLDGFKLWLHHLSTE